jgi:NADPH:quinone reductase-like Zn-dependent oxidoreductase
MSFCRRARSDFSQGGDVQAVVCESAYHRRKEYSMKAVVAQQKGGPEVVELVEMARPVAGAGEVLVRVAAAGVGPWDALIREDQSVTAVKFPVVLGSDVAGTVEELGAGVTAFRKGDAVYGSTNAEFIGGYAEYAVCKAGMIAKKPAGLNWHEAASSPVVSVTALQGLFEYGKVMRGQTVLILGAAGNVGAYAIQLAKEASARVIAVASAKDKDFVERFGADMFVDHRSAKFEDVAQGVDCVLDMVGGDARERGANVLKPGGMLVTVESPVPDAMKKRYGARAIFFLVEVTTARLEKIGKLFEAEKLRSDVGTLVPLAEARKAHEMLAGAPHSRGKIVLEVGE